MNTNEVVRKLQTDELKQVRVSNGGLGEEQQDVDQSITQYLQSDIGDRNTVNEEEEEYDEDDDDMGDYGDDDQDNMIDDQLGGSGYY
ncbi:MAG: hypothetical protein EZS28_001952 [Streblomastix strix]|uniref:Uncharacterized protein n=2 Tax=Streblomastix strix TaxID=222440 RepID=A0A5J4X5M4_9EUKA|nr:MAG: hypothetical protein EZS28_001952 [Streblomastix strix]